MPNTAAISNAQTRRRDATGRLGVRAAGASKDPDPPSRRIALRDVALGRRIVGTTAPSEGQAAMIAVPMMETGAMTEAKTIGSRGAALALMVTGVLTVL